jgi:hypothetical protein
MMILISIWIGKTKDNAIDKRKRKEKYFVSTTARREKPA